MIYKYGTPIFEKEDIELAKEVLLEKYIPKDASSFAKSMLGGSYGKLIESLYGVNIVLMANFYQTQTFFYDKVKQSLMNHFFSNDLTAKLIGYSVSNIASKALVIEATNNEDFVPVSIWNPKREWNEGMFELQKDKRINFVNPTNTLNHVSLELDQKEMQVDCVRLIAALFNDPYVKIMPTETKLYIRLLPYATPMHLLNIMDAIYETF